MRAEVCPTGARNGSGLVGVGNPAGELTLDHIAYYLEFSSDATTCGCRCQ
jgi:hypothetical protein